MSAELIYSLDFETVENGYFMAQKKDLTTGEWSSVNSASSANATTANICTTDYHSGSQCGFGHVDLNDNTPTFTLLPEGEKFSVQYWLKMPTERTNVSNNYWPLISDVNQNAIFYLLYNATTQRYYVDTSGSAFSDYLPSDFDPTVWNKIEICTIHDPTDRKIYYALYINDVKVIFQGECSNNSYSYNCGFTGIRYVGTNAAAYRLCYFDELKYYKGLLHEDAGCEPPTVTEDNLLYFIDCEDHTDIETVSANWVTTKLKIGDYYVTKNVVRYDTSYIKYDGIEPGYICIKSSFYLLSNNNALYDYTNTTYEHYLKREVFTEVGDAYPSGVCIGSGIVGSWSPNFYIHKDTNGYYVMHDTKPIARQVGYLPNEFNPWKWFHVAFVTTIDGTTATFTVFINGKKITFNTAPTCTINYASFPNENFGGVSRDNIKYYASAKYSDDFNLNNNPNAVIVASESAIITGESTTLDASESYLAGGTITGYLWSTGETTASITVSPTENTYYSCKVTGNNGLTATGYTYITVATAPPQAPHAVITASEIECHSGDTVTLSARNSFCTGSSITGYLWSTGETTEEIHVQPEVTTVYTLRVTAANNLSNETTVRITVVSETDVDFMKWLPEYWHPNKEMIEILDRDEEEYTTYKGEQAQVYTDAFIMQASEARISQWEHALELPPSGTLNARRIAVYNKLFSVTKLTEEIIRSHCASIYNGAGCTVTLSNSIIHVTVMLKHSQQEITDLSALADALETKRPLHIGLDVQREYFTWNGVKTIFTTWTATKAEDAWRLVLLHIED